MSDAEDLPDDLAASIEAHEASIEEFVTDYDADEEDEELRAIAAEIEAETIEARDEDASTEADEADD